MTIVCEVCYHECETKEEDQGIGPYEYGSENAVDVKMVEVSACCESDFRLVDEEEGHLDYLRDVLSDKQEIIYHLHKENLKLLREAKT